MSECRSTGYLTGQGLEALFTCGLVAYEGYEGGTANGLSQPMDLSHEHAYWGRDCCWNHFTINPIPPMVKDWELNKAKAIES